MRYLFTNNDIQHLFAMQIHIPYLSIYWVYMIPIEAVMVEDLILLF